MNHRLFAGFLLALASLLFVGCSADNATPGASQVTNLHEVDFSVFEKTLDNLPSRAAFTRADGTSSVPLSQTNLFSELEVCMIPVNDVGNVNYRVRQLSTEDNFGETKLYVPDGDYYLVVVAANTKNPVKNHQITIKSTTEVDFPDGILTDMAYSYQKVKIGKDKQSLTVQLKRAVSAFLLSSTDLVPSNIKTLEVTFTKGAGPVFNPSTGHCAKEASMSRVYDLTTHINYQMKFTMYVLLPQDDENTAEVLVKATDQKGGTIKSMTFSNVHMVNGKRTTYQGPLFTATTSASFTIDEGSIGDADGVHNFD